MSNLGIARRGLCFVLAAPSGAGKTSISRALLGSEPELALSVSVTTRTPRDGEVDGVHYFFRDQAEFERMAGAGELLEWAHVFGRHYGTPRAPVEASLSSGRDVMFDIDWQGHQQVRTAMPADVVSIFLLPPSLDALRSRLVGRGDKPEAVESRMAEAWSEISHAGEFDHVLVNDDFNATLAEVRAILHAARTATARQTGLAGFLAGLR